MTTPPWRLGVHLTAITIQRLSVSAAGVFSNLGSPLNIQALIEDLGHQVRQVMEDIGPVTSTQMNMVAIRIGNALRITELKQSNAESKIHLVQDTATYCLISWTEGNETFAGYFRVGNMDGGIRGRGAQRVTCEFEPCDPGQAQVARSAA